MTAPSEPDGDSSADLPGRAGDAFRRVQRLWKRAFAARQPGREVQLLVATPFGIHRATSLQVEGADMLSIGILADKDGASVLYVPVEQCSFMVSHFKPKRNEDRIIVGFGATSAQRHLTNR